MYYILEKKPDGKWRRISVDLTLEVIKPLVKQHKKSSSQNKFKYQKVTKHSPKFGEFENEN